MYEMLFYQLAKKTRGRPVRCGAPLAQADLSDLCDSISNSAVSSRVVLDFDGIEAVNGSYVRATVAWLIRCAMTARKRFTQSIDDADPWQIRPLKIEQLFARNLTDDVRDEIDGLLRRPDIKLPCLEILAARDTHVTNALLLGHLDRQLAICLHRLYQIGGTAKAGDLHHHYPGDHVQITAWNNRLGALYERLLVSRRKEGRFWVYQTVTKKLKYYGIQIPT